MEKHAGMTAYSLCSNGSYKHLSGSEVYRNADRPLLVHWQSREMNELHREFLSFSSVFSEQTATMWV
jgi:hypothetical protein